MVRASVYWTLLAFMLALVILPLAGAVGLPLLIQRLGGPGTATDSTRLEFGNGKNQFTIDFVMVGNPGNPPDTTGDPNPAGSVPYLFQIGKYEVSRSMVFKANEAGQLGIGLDPMDGANEHARPDMPAMGWCWNEVARFVNWLNTSQGFHPAYKFRTQPGDSDYRSNEDIQLWTADDAGYDPTNLFRNKLARYVLPSADEWYKAAYYDPTKDGGRGGYWDYPTRSDSPPVSVPCGIRANTAVWEAREMADIDKSGGLSTYGTMAQGGNIAEWVETEDDLRNDKPAARRIVRGSGWYHKDGSWPEYMSVRFRFFDAKPDGRTIRANAIGVRVVCLPETR